MGVSAEPAGRAVGKVPADEIDAYKYKLSDLRARATDRRKRAGARTGCDGGGTAGRRAFALGLA
jgi:hypothetical protein